MTAELNRKRRADVRRRAATKDVFYSYCRIIGCGNPTTAGAGKGLNRLYCKKHEDHYERHGSYVKGSYTAAELEPHRKAARKWLRENRENRSVVLAVRAVAGLYRRAGPHVEAFRLRGLSPKDRARAAWARLREAKVEPTRVLEAWLAVVLTIRADVQPDRHTEYLRVQAAKVVHRMASGSHKRWDRQRPDGSVLTTELHKYPQSRGKVLRHFGEQIERAASLLKA